MDRYGTGFINVNNFANWVYDNCGYQIADEDLPLLERALDGVNDYRITREGFIETVSVPQDPEEEEEQEVQAQQQQQNQKTQQRGQSPAAPSKGQDKALSSTAKTKK